MKYLVVWQHPQNSHEDAEGVSIFLAEAENEKEDEAIRLCHGQLLGTATDPAVVEAITWLRDGRRLYIHGHPEYGGGGLPEVTDYRKIVYTGCSRHYGTPRALERRDPRPLRLVFNGRTMLRAPGTVGYKWAVEEALGGEAYGFMKRGGVLSVTWHLPKEPGRHGILSVDRTVRLEEGMVFNTCETNRA